MKRVLSVDPEARRKTTYHYDNDGSQYITTEQDVTEILDVNKRVANQYEKNSMIGNTQKHHQEVANIPLTIFYDLKKKFGDPQDNPEAKKKWKAWLNDPDNRFFRTGGGQI